MRARTHRLPSLVLGLVFALGWWLGGRGPSPAAVGAAGPADFREAVERAGPSIVHVAVTLAPGAPGARSRDDGVGSGFVLSADGLIATSRHVVQGAQVIAVDVPGRGLVAGTVVGHDERVDLTVLRVPLSGLTPLALGSSRELAVGQWVLAVGSPFRLERSWSAGIVSGLHRRQVAVDPRAAEDYIQTDAAANLGNSGGPLLDASGRAVGMVTQILTRAGGFQGISLATPIEAVVAAAQRLTGRAEGSPAPVRPTLGLLVRDEPPGEGLTVTRVRPGGPAAQAGVLPGDRLLTLDGQPLASSADLAARLAAAAVGRTVTVDLLRQRQRLQVRIVLGADTE